MPFLDVLAHTGWPVQAREMGDYIEGEYDSSPIVGTPFDCCLFLPQGSSSPEGRGRRVREPTLLYDPEDRLGVSVALSAEDELLIMAEELNVAEGRSADAQTRWIVVGSPQPFGKPGDDPIGFQVTLRAVDD